MHEFKMPMQGLVMETGVIEKWLKKEGDEVKEGELLLEISSDKGVLEIESDASGILKKILKAEGEEVPVTETIAYIEQAGS